MVLPQLHLLISHSDTRLPSLQTFTITLRLFKDPDQDALYASLPFQRHSCKLVPKEHEDDVLPFLEALCGEKYSLITPLITIGIAPNLRNYKMVFGGEGRVVVYPSSTLMRVLWEVSGHDIVFQHSQGNSITHVG
jgi:hypothetical protein